MTVLATLKDGVISKGDNAGRLPSIKGGISHFTEIKFLQAPTIFTVLPTPYCLGVRVLWFHVIILGQFPSMYMLDYHLSIFSSLLAQIVPPDNLSRSL